MGRDRLRWNQGGNIAADAGNVNPLFTEKAERDVRKLRGAATEARREGGDGSVFDLIAAAKRRARGVVDGAASHTESHVASKATAAAAAKKVKKAKKKAASVAAGKKEGPVTAGEERGGAGAEVPPPVDLTARLVQPGAFVGASVLRCNYVLQAGAVTQLTGAAAVHAELAKGQLRDARRRERRKEQASPATSLTRH